MKKLAVIVLGVAIICGCRTSGTRSMLTRVRVLNHSGRDIIFVVVDPDGEASPFGFLAHGKSGATVTGCIIRFSNDFAIQWKEEGKSRKALVDVMSIMEQYDRVQKVTFTYVGEGKWITSAEGTLNATGRNIRDSDQRQ